MTKDNRNTTDFGAMLERDMQKFSPEFSPGQKVSGIVSAIDETAVFIDIGGRSEGILNREEVTDKDGSLQVEEGQTIEVFFVGDRDGEIRLTRRVGGSDADVSAILDAWENGIPVEGRVAKEINGGFEVEVGGHRGFCPYSQIDLHRQDAAAYLGEKYRFLITQCDDSLRNLVVARRPILEQEHARMQEELRDRLEPGAIIEGTVRRLMDFGVFVDLGAGVDGLIHVSELGWGRDIKPEDVVAPGDRVSVMVRNLDWEKQRISLSLRHAQANPWETAAERYPRGRRLSGTVTKLMPFGAFVELEPGIEGLLHISKLGGGRRINHPREVVEENTRIEVVVENLDAEAQRLSLGLDDGSTATEEWEEEDRDGPPSAPEPGEKSASFGSLGDLFDNLDMKSEKND